MTKIRKKSRKRTKLQGAQKAKLKCMYIITPKIKYTRYVAQEIKLASDSAILAKS